LSCGPTFTATPALAGTDSFLTFAPSLFAPHSPSGVTTAKAVAVIRPPVIAEAAEEGREIGRALMVNADRHTIICSLNLHMLLHSLKHRWRGGHDADDAGTDGVDAPPFTLCEVVHESNILFLREQMRRAPASTAAAAAAPRCCCCCSGGPPREVSESFFDWPVIAAGALLPHTLLDSIMTQAFFNQDAVSFWEAVMQTGLQGVCHEAATADSGSGDGKAQTRGDWPSNHSTIGGGNGRSSAFASLAPPPPPIKRSLSDILFADRGSSSFTSPGQSFLEHTAVVDRERYVIEGNSSSSSESSDSAGSTPAGDDRKGSGPPAPAVPPSCFDKVEVPVFLAGASFERLFHAFLDTTGAIAIGIFRRPRGEDERAVGADLPFVITAPEADVEVLGNDEVFIFRPTLLPTFSGGRRKTTKKGAD